MSLNISPETKLGKIEGWNPEEFLKKDNRKTYSLTNKGNLINRYTETELKRMFENESIGIATNGVIYRTDKAGLLPALLKKWFDELFYK
jgi:hypothetical protein